MGKSVQNQTLEEKQEQAKRARAAKRTKLNQAPERPVVIWKPHPGRQTLFLQNNAYECGFGGCKGPGKTECLILESLRNIHLGNFRGILFRRTFPRLGEIIDRTFKYFRGIGGKYSDKDIQVKLPAWTFPSGAKIMFGHMQYESDKYNYQGRELHGIFFDQLEEFTETQFLYILAQNRSSDTSIRPYVRSSFNPGGVGHAWVKRRYVDPLF
ncbi:MAG: hypothetical protein IH995_03995, partial [Proteobacteria bacterium]|nr:hypothetical protein [Pseudomonadota bacterium]